MIFREAQIADITQMHVVRIAVTENILPDPDLITAKDYVEFLTERGKGWVCEIDDIVVGFSNRGAAKLFKVSPTYDKVPPTNTVPKLPREKSCCADKFPENRLL